LVPRAVTIYGIGLIGGSLALALKKAVPGVRITGVDRQEALERARKLGLVDAGPAGPPDLIVLAAPVGEILKLIDEIAASVPRTALVIDVGSTKTEICRRAAERGLPFVGGHPMAGRERAGPGAADADLFKDAQFYLCEIPSTPPGAVGRMEDLVRRIGGVPLRATPAEHDRRVAQLSHLPQLLSAVLMDQTADIQRFAGSGWERWTRLAASPFHVWRDIFATSGFLPEALEAFIARLEGVRKELESGNLEGIAAVFERANRVKAGEP
jgi:prephenate dehydrogenase